MFCTRNRSYTSYDRHSVQKFPLRPPATGVLPRKTLQKPGAVLFWLYQGRRSAVDRLTPGRHQRHRSISSAPAQAPPVTSSHHPCQTHDVYFGMRFSHSCWFMHPSCERYFITDFLESALFPPLCVCCIDVCLNYRHLSLVESHTLHLSFTLYTSY